MEIHRPGAKPLTAEQGQMLAVARATLHRNAVSGGLDQDDVRAIARALRARLEVGHAVLQLLFEEVSQLPEGQRLLRFDD
jgi:hypothetical protein